VAEHGRSARARPAVPDAGRAHWRGVGAPVLGGFECWSVGHRGEPTGPSIGEPGEALQTEVAAGHRPLVGLLEHEGADEADGGGEKDPDHVGSALDLLVEPLEGLPTLQQVGIGLASMAFEGCAGSNGVPAASMAQATARRRSATDRRARAWP